MIVSGGTTHRIQPTPAALGPRTRRAVADALAQERRRLAANVHDLILQDLSFALANIRALADDPSCPPCAAKAATAVTAADQALEGAREVMRELVMGPPAEHVAEPIVRAVEASARAAARRTTLRFDASRAPASAELDSRSHDALVHITREAVTNAVKHARTSAVEVVLEQADHWRLTVRDDGLGFDEVPDDAGFGLFSMRQAAHALGGAVHVESAPGRGTTVEAVIP
jgi:signal transduction histidine kinase